MLQESQPSVLLWIVAETGRETRWICGWLSNLKKIIFPLALPQHCWNVLFTHVKRRLWGHSFSQSVFYSAGAELKNWITFKFVEWLFGPPHTHTHFFLLFFIQDSGTTFHWSQGALGNISTGLWNLISRIWESSPKSAMAHPHSNNTDSGGVLASPSLLQDTWVGLQLLDTC